MRYIIALIIGSIGLFLLLSVVLPEIVLEQQIKFQTGHLLEQSDKATYGEDLPSQKFLDRHQLHLLDVTDEQGADQNTSYHVGTTSEGYQLGIKVLHYHPDNLYSKIKIISIKVWNPS